MTLPSLGQTGNERIERAMAAAPYTRVIILVEMISLVPIWLSHGARWSAWFYFLLQPALGIVAIIIYFAGGRGRRIMKEQLEKLPSAEIKHKDLVE